MANSSTPRHVRVTLPDGLYGGQMRELFESMGLEAKPGEAMGEWIVRESISRRPWAESPLVESKTLAAPWLRTDRFDLLQPPAQDADEPYLLKSEVDEERRAIHESGARNSLAVHLYKLQFDIVTATDNALTGEVRAWHDELSKLRFEGDPNSELIFPGLSTHWLSIDHRVYSRFRLPSIGLRFEHDPELLEQIQRGGAGELSDRSVFAANEAVNGPGILTGTFVGPLLACRSPDIWATQGQRLGSVIIFSLGNAITGVSPVPSEPLHLLPRSSPTRRQDRPEETSSRSWADAVDWWALKLDQMFTYLSDPCSYSDSHGKYLPYHHQNWMMNAEELFNRVTSTLLAWRDQYATRILTFSALDLVSEVFLGGDMSDLCKPARAKKALLKVEAAMPAAVSEVLLPHVKTAVSSLPDVAQGFFIRDYRGTDTVDVVQEDGSTERLPPDRAISAVLRARRNATHGFGGGDLGSSRILAQHDGRLPDELAYLPFLYFLEVLCYPENIRRRIVGQCRAANRRA